MMNITDKRDNRSIAEYADKYLSGVTTIKEEEELRRALEQSVSLSKEYSAVLVMLNESYRARQLHKKEYRKRMSLKIALVGAPIGMVAVLTAVIAFGSLHVSQSEYGIENGVTITNKEKAIQLAEDAFNEVMYDSSNTINDVL